MEQLVKLRGRNEIHRKNHPFNAKNNKPHRNKLLKLAFLSNTDLFAVKNLALLDDLMSNHTTNTKTTAISRPVTTETSPTCSSVFSSTVARCSTPQIISKSTFGFNNTNKKNSETISIQYLSSDDGSEEEVIAANKQNNNYIFYQNGDMKLTFKDMITCRNKNLLNDICIEAFMRSFDNKKMFVLNYFFTNKLALSSKGDEINLSIKVK